MEFRFDCWRPVLISAALCIAVALRADEAPSYSAAELAPAGDAANAAPNPTAPRTSVLVQSNGVVLCPNPFARFQVIGGSSNAPIRLDFGLPQRAPVRRGHEDAVLPIARTTWEDRGIRYTQSVLITRLGRGDLVPVWTQDAVLLVNLFGENTTTEYTEASAELGITVEGRPLELDWRGGMVYGAPTNGAPAQAVGFIDIPSGGVAGARGTHLRFRGSMPPATTGSMTVKIPLAPLATEPQLNALQDLDYDEEFQRVKRFWSARLKANSVTSDQLPVISCR